MGVTFFGAIIGVIGSLHRKSKLLGLEGTPLKCTVREVWFNVGTCFSRTFDSFECLFLATHVLSLRSNW